MPVAGKTADQIDLRAKYFHEMLGHEMLDMQVKLAANRGVEVVYYSKVDRLLAECYFALSQAYKALCLPDGVGSDPTKQAAITCVTVAEVSPLRCISTDKPIEQEEFLYVNQMLAMWCSCTIVRHEFRKRPFYDRLRVYRGLRNYSFPCIRPIIDEARRNNGDIISQFDISISSDEVSRLHILIDEFILYAQFVPNPLLRRDS